jgi:hypothetical protein
MPITTARRAFLEGGLALLLLALVPPGAAAAPAGTAPGTGWVCGQVVDESLSFIAGATVKLYLGDSSGTAGKEPMAQVVSEEHGGFCLRDLAPGFYQLQVEDDRWPTQLTRKVEVRAGLVNRLTPPVELELEPGDPHVNFGESFDTMAPGEARAVMERLLEQGDAASLQELARRLLPKRGALLPLNMNQLVIGLDVKPLVKELLRQLDRGLPPLKTARYVYLIGELSDPDTRTVIVPVLLRYLSDGRPLPSLVTRSSEGDHGTSYVSDIAIVALTRQAGKDFKWKYGLSPMQNQAALNRAREWWRREVEKERDKQR